MLLQNRPNALKKAAPTVYLLVATGLLYLLFANWSYDDPYITYRYAQNLAHGLGFVYNPGERVQSTTTPFFALLLSPAGLLGLDLPRVANLISAASAAAGGYFLWRLGRTLQTPAAGWAGLLLYPAFPLLMSTTGSETPLYLAFCLGAFAFYLERRYNLTAVMAALAVLARPDGALVPALLAVHYLIFVRQPIPWKSILLFLGITLPWFLFALAYFGSPLPATLVAKQRQGSMAISQRFAPGFIGLARAYAGLWIYPLEALLAGLGLAFSARRSRNWWLVFAWTLLYFAAYSYLGVSRYYWYYAPLVPGFIAAAGLGVEQIRRWLPLKREHLSFGLMLSLVAIISLVQANNLRKTSQNVDQRLVIYRQIGRWLEEETPPGSSVGTLEVGIIGYYARRPMIDFAGLIQPDIARQLGGQATYEDAALWAVEHYRPNYLVLQQDAFPRLEQQIVSQSCTLTKEFSGETYHYSANINLYRCFQ